MSNDAHVALRLPADVLVRADALAERLAADPGLRALTRITRSSVLRAALVHGLAVLEERHPIENKEKPT